MKFNKEISCVECSLKCDIYQALKQSNTDGDSIEVLHVFYKRHEVICKQGAKVTHSIFLINGTAKLFIEGLNNRNVMLYILKPNNYIGLLSFFESSTYAYSVVALEDTQVCMVDLGFVKSLYMRNHDLLLKLNMAFGKSVQLIMNKIISLSQKQIRGRVAESILYLADLNKGSVFHLNLTRKELGELSGISEENTVRIISEFKNEKIISVSGREITILDKHLLSRICDFG
jgi:CRP-like cAMP-binding protein